MAGIMESLKGRKGRKSPPSSAASEDAKAPGATVTATGPEASSPPNAATVACKEPAIQVIRSPTIDVGTMTSPGQEDEGTGGPGAGAAEKAKGKEKEKAGQREEGYKWLVGPVAGAFLGNALLLGVGCLLVLLWQLFEEFREPLLWGLWFSVVLRSTKEWLVAMLGKYLRER